MAEPEERELQDLEEKIEEVRRDAEEHGTLPREERTLVDPDGDGEPDPYRPAPPG